MKRILIVVRGIAFAVWLVASGSCYGQTATPSTRLSSAFVRQPAHTMRVYSVAFSPDGRMLVSASWDGTIKLWDVRQGTELRTLAGHSKGIYKALFSPDGKFLASASRDGTVKIWNVATGENTRSYVGDSMAVKAVAWSPDGRLIASGGNDGVIKLTDASSMREVRTLRHAGRGGAAALVNILLFSSDGKMLAARNWDGTISLWDVQQGSERQIALASPDAAISSIALSPDARQLAVSDEGNKIKFWETASLRLVRTLEAPTVEGAAAQIVSLAFSPDGRTLASGEARLEEARGRYQGVVKLWSLETGRVAQERAAHVMEPDTVAFSPDGQILATCGAEGGVKLWNMKLEETKVLSPSPLETRGLKFLSFDMPNAERMLPQTPAALVMVEYLGAYNSGNVYLMNGFAQERLSPTLLSRKPAVEQAIETLRLYQELGEVELRSVEAAKEDEIAVVAESLKTKERVSIRLQIEAAKPNGVSAIQIRRLPPQR